MVAGEYTPSTSDEIVEGSASGSTLSAPPALWHRRLGVTSRSGVSARCERFGPAQAWGLGAFSPSPEAGAGGPAFIAALHARSYFEIRMRIAILTEAGAS